jgi:TPR repeat protein
MLRAGRGGRNDAQEAARWFRLAAAQGHTYAQTNLGIMYANGEGVPRNLVSARMWLSIASENGLEDAYKFRARLEGVMTKADIEEATTAARICLSSGYQACN